ncbi:hypothetical protein Q7P37_000500 [Cladosporium fusiforme]
MPASLLSLPVEIRRAIFSLVLVEHAPICIRRYNSHNQQDPVVVRAYHNDAPDRHSKIYDKRSKKWAPVLSFNTSLLHTNKQVFAETAPILYGSNKFSFYCTGSLERFLSRIHGMKTHLRHIILQPGSLVRKLPRGREPFPAAKRSLEALVAAKDLRSLYVSQLDFCTQKAPPPRLALILEASVVLHGALDIQEFVELCKPLLQSLEASYEAKSLGSRVLDVV